MYKYWALFLGISIFSGCRQKNEIKYSEESKILNNRALALIESNPDSALFLLDSAIKLDPNNSMAYFNMMHVYCNKGDYQKAIEVGKKELELKPDFAEGRFFLGMLYEKNGQQEKAYNEYSNALQVFNDRIKKNEGSKKIDNEINRAVVLVFLGKEEGKMKLEEIIAKNPQDKSLEIFKNFDKNEYLNSIFQK